MIEKMAKGTKKDVSGEDFDEKEDYLFMKETGLVFSSKDLSSRLITDDETTPETRAFSTIFVTKFT